MFGIVRLIACFVAKGIIGIVQQNFAVSANERRHIAVAVQQVAVFRRQRGGSELILIADDFCRRLVQLPGVAHQTVQIPQAGSEIETVHDALVGDELDVDVLSLDYTAVLLEFIGLALHTEGTEDRQGTEVIQVVVSITMTRNCPR